MELGIRGRRALVMGASRGLGRACAEALAREGAAVTIVALADPLPSSYPHVKGGRLKALAVTSRERVAFMPEVPTMAESGFPGFEMLSWYGLWGPPALPRDIVDRLATEVAKAVKSPEMQEKLASQGFLPKGSTAPEFAAYVKDEIAKYAKIVKDANIKVD